jgi:predicted dehydrogenase
MKKTAICGVWHVHAEDYTKLAMKYSEVIGVWDADQDRRKDFCARLGLPELDSFEDLIASDADQVIVCSSSDTHASLMIEIAKAKKDIFTEKVLALTNEDCEAVASAVRENGVRFAISLVHKYNPGPITVKSVVDSGELGKITYVRFRNCHNGSIAGWLPRHFYDLKECGGGAMIDLGAHGFYLATQLLGMPTSVKSVFTSACENPETIAKNPDNVEDNAVTVMGFDSGAIAINETSFVSGAFPMMLEVDGEKGYVRFSEGKVIKKIGGALSEVEMLPATPSPLARFLTDGDLSECDMDDALDLSRVMVEAYK